MTYGASVTPKFRGAPQILLGVDSADPNTSVFQAYRLRIAQGPSLRSPLGNSIMRPLASDHDGWFYDFVEGQSNAFQSACSNRCQHAAISIFLIELRRVELVNENRRLRRLATIIVVGSSKCLERHYTCACVRVMSTCW